MYIERAPNRNSPPAILLRVDRRKTCQRQILQGLIAAGVLYPQSKRATIEAWQQWPLPRK